MKKAVLESYIKEVLLSEQIGAGQPMKVKDVKAALALLKKEKGIDAAKKVAKSVGKAGAGTILGFLGLGGAKDAAEALITAADTIGDFWEVGKSLTPKQKDENPLWTHFFLDRDTSEIVDDTVEDNFMRDLAAKVKTLSDDDELPDADEQLNSWLKGKFNNTSIKKGQ